MKVIETFQAMGYSHEDAKAYINSGTAHVYNGMSVAHRHLESLLCHVPLIQYERFVTKRELQNALNNEEKIQSDLTLIHEDNLEPIIRHIPFWLPLLRGTNRRKIVSLLALNLGDHLENDGDMSDFELFLRQLEYCGHLLSREMKEWISNTIAVQANGLIVRSHVTAAKLKKWKILPEIQTPPNDIPDHIAGKIIIVKHVDSKTNVCPDTEPYHLSTIEEQSTLQDEELEDEFRNYTLVCIAGVIIGSIKHAGAKSFIAWKNYTLPDGRVLLKKGGLYKVNLETKKAAKHVHRQSNWSKGNSPTILHCKTLQLKPHRTLGGTDYGEYGDLNPDDFVTAIDAELPYAKEYVWQSSKSPS